MTVRVQSTSLFLWCVSVYCTVIVLFLFFVFVSFAFALLSFFFYAQTVDISGVPIIVTMNTNSDEWKQLERIVENQEVSGVCVPRAPAPAPAM